MIDPRCAICKSPDVRRLVELGWNAKMSAVDIAAALGGRRGLGHTAVLTHLKEHAEGGNIRAIPVEEAQPLRARVYAIQKMQVEEIERRVLLAQQRAEDWNSMPEHEDDQKDWSHWFDILDKDMQAAVASILKAQGIKDKQESTERGQKIDLFRALTAAGSTPPAVLIGDGHD